MTGRERLALGCLLPGFEGLEAPRWVRRRVAEGLGGVVLFGRNVETREQLKHLTDALHAERAGVVVAIDEEGGEVTRLEARTGSSYPGNLALGRADEAALTRDVATALGAELAAAGVDLDLAPVADLNVDTRNPIVGARSFGSDAALVARQTAAWVEGLQAAGVAACAKHFPGHGDTAVDSHLELPVVGADPRMGALEPFQAAIAAGVRAIMSAHVVAPALDSMPATMSARIMTGLLRGELGFAGLAVSDALEMGGAGGASGVVDAAVRAVTAGCDALIVGGGLRDEGVVLEIARALASQVPEERLAAAAARLERVKVRGATARTRAGAALEAARRALCVDGDVAVGGQATVVRMPSPSSIAAGDVPWGMADALRERGVHVADAGRLVIAVRDLHRQPGNQHAVDEMLARHPAAIVVEMGVPVCRPAAARSYLATFGSARVCAQAAAEAMTGAIRR